MAHEYAARLRYYPLSLSVSALPPLSCLWCSPPLSGLGVAETQIKKKINSTKIYIHKVNLQ